MTFYVVDTFTQDYTREGINRKDLSLNVNIAYHEEHRRFSSAVRGYHDIGKMKILDFY